MPTSTTVALSGRRIAIPESRQLDLFADMLETRGANVLRCPLVNIRDAPDPTPIKAWLQDFVAGGCDDLILLTGEGLRRLYRVAEHTGNGLDSQFVQALGKVRKITRGPKPARALRELGLRADLPASHPTTDGVIETLRKHDLTGQRIGVQLYGTDPNEKLIDYLQSAGATTLPVAPYIYADESEDDQVLTLIDELVDGQLDAIAFTSSPQVRRLFSVARKQDRETALQQALTRVCVAAVGPVVADTLRKREIEVDLMPDSSYFMKPLVRELVRRFQP